MRCTGGISKNPLSSKNAELGIWAKHRRRKAAAKCHLRLDLQSFLLRFAIMDTARGADAQRARELCAGIQEGEIVIFDKAYLDFDMTCRVAGIHQVSNHFFLNFCGITVFPIQRNCRGGLSYRVIEGCMAPTTKLDDELIDIQKSRQGDPDAFAALVARHQYMIHALTFRMTGSPADAEDLAQETFIEAFRQLASFRAEAKFSSWLYRIAVNLCLNWQKGQRRRQHLLQQWAGEQAVAAAATDARTQQIQEALLQLNPKQRAAVVLTVYEGLSHAQAARALGCSETTISWRVFTARSKLKKLLTPLAAPGGEA